jgi:hypothetical protein
MSLFKKVNIDYSKLQTRPPVQIPNFFMGKNFGVYTFYLVTPSDSNDVLFETKHHWVDGKKYRCYGENCARCADGIETETETSFLLYMTDSNNQIYPVNKIYFASFGYKASLYLVEMMQKNDWEYNKKIRVELASKLKILIQDKASEQLPSLEGIQIPNMNDVIRKQTQFSLK